MERLRLGVALAAGKVARRNKVAILVLELADQIMQELAVHCEHGVGSENEGAHTRI